MFQNSLQERCQEVMETVWIKRRKRMFLAHKIAYGNRVERLEAMVPFLRAEIEMHREVRSIWPYILAIPNVPVVKQICDDYGADAEKLGQLIDPKLQHLTRWLEVIETENHSRSVKEWLWTEIREEVYGKLTREAIELLEQR